MAKKTATQKENPHETTPQQQGITQLLVEWRNGNKQALDAI